MSTKSTLVHVDHDRLLRTFVDVLSVDSYWGHEDRVVAIIRPLLEAVGVVCTQDKIGNLIGRWPANGKDIRPIMLNAHMDTVQPTPQMRPVVKDDVVYSDGSSVLGADDKAGVAAIVEAVRAVHEAGRDHGPIDLVFTVGEDVGQFGADAFDPHDIEARVGVVFDLGRPVGEVVTRQAGICSLDATFHGRAAAAAVPAPGISAIAMLARAVDNMTLGRVDELTVANVGVVSGGQARNIVPPEAKLVGQVRGLVQEALDRQIAAMRKAVEDAAAAFGGHVEIEQQGRFSPTQFSPDDPAIRLAETAIRAAGLEPRHTSTFGGSDAQNFNEKGITTAILACGYRDMHTLEESIPRESLRQLTQVAAQLILGA
jgi:tripeptide aminopeptidase